MVEKGGRKSNRETSIEDEAVPLAWNRRGRNRNDITTGGIGVNFGRLLRIPGIYAVALVFTLSCLAKISSIC